MRLTRPRAPRASVPPLLAAPLLAAPLLAAPLLAAPLLLAAAALVPLVPHAAAAQGVEIGVRGGAARSTARFTMPAGGPRLPDDGVAPMPRVTSGAPHRGRTAAAGGLFVRVPIVGPVSFQPELLLVPKGFEVTQPTLHLTYLEVPLLLRVDAGLDGDLLRPFVLGGVAPAYELGCRLANAPGEACDAPAAPGFSTATRRWDVGWVVGAGVALRAGPGRLVLDARLTTGVRNIEAAPRPQYGTRNRSSALTFGYALPLWR